MARFRWRTNAAGVVLVSDRGGPFTAPTLGPKMAAVMDRVIGWWGGLADQHEQRTGVPRNEQLACVARESGGMAGARNDNDHPPGLGLWQITYPGFYRGRTQTEVMVPTTNWEIGVDFWADIRRHQLEPDLPSVASVFNAGGVGVTWHPHPETDDERFPWGYHETRGHISAEVAMSNYELGKRLGPEVLELPAPLDDVTVAQAMGVVSADLWELAGELLDDERRRHEADRRARIDAMFGERPTLPEIPAVR